MAKKRLALFLLFIFSYFLFAEEQDTFFLSVSGGMTLDVAGFGLEKKFISLGTTIQIPYYVSPGLKPQFSFNNDMWSLYLPAILSVPIGVGGKKKFRFEPYAGGGLVYNSDSSTFYPLVEGGFMIHAGTIFCDFPIYCYFYDKSHTFYNDRSNITISDLTDLLIGFNVGKSF